MAVRWRLGKGLLAAGEGAAVWAHTLVTAMIDMAAALRSFICILLGNLILTKVRFISLFPTAAESTAGRRKFRCVKILGERPRLTRHGKSRIVQLRIRDDLFDRYFLSVLDAIHCRHQQIGHH